MAPTSPTLPAYAHLEFPEPPADRPYVLVNMVMSADGKIVVEGTEQGLGSPADQALMKALRSHADAVLNGAETLRRSGSTPTPGDGDMAALREARGLPRSPLGVIVTASGAVPLDASFFTSRDFEAVVFVLESTPGDRREALAATGREVVVLPDEGTATELLGVLRKRFGVRLLLCEGGALLNGALFDAGAVDEYFVTVGALIVGGDVALTPVRGNRAPSFSQVRPLTLLSAIPNPDTNEVYLRYRVGTPEGRASS